MDPAIEAKLNKADGLIDMARDEYRVALETPIDDAFTSLLGAVKELREAVALLASQAEGK
jgi:hypothetical protein